ncbi:MAG: CBS domain-containing protein [Desulfatitalea sp.]|nr:CBS domain-containing protein [Desulfatitalea sp.]
MNAAALRECAPVDISEDDVMNAMRTIQGYIDITPADFREIYQIAYTLARKRMLTALKAADVMTTPVITIAEGMDLLETASLLAVRNISGAPVVDTEARIIGVISEKDFLARMGAGPDGSFMHVIAHCLKHKGCVAVPMKSHSAGEIMTAPPITGTPDRTIADISSLFTEHNINRLPIVDSENRPIGIVTRSDLVSGLCMLV